MSTPPFPRVEVPILPRVEIPAHLLDRRPTMQLDRTLAQQAARARDRWLVDEVRYLVARVCPFPVHLYYEPDHGRFVIRAAGVRLAAVDDDQLRAVDDVLGGALDAARAPRRVGVVAAYLAVAARDGYRNLAVPPLPDNVVLGDS